MANIFISYSRKDIVFVRNLVETLRIHEMGVWVDLEDIPPTVNWREEIQKGIEEADIFLFIISPDSIASDICKEELEIAVKNGKRLIPVVTHEITWEDAPPELSKLNYIFFRKTDDSNTAFDSLLTAINTDYEWAQTHRRIQVRALEWERGAKDNAFLLRGSDLEEAERLYSINATRDPHPTDIQREYLLKSRQVTDRQRKIITGSLSAAVIVMLGIIVVLAYPYIAQAVAKIQTRRDLVFIQGGTMKFGTNDQNKIDIGFVSFQDISLPDFLIGKYEVTNKLYKQCVLYGNCTPPLEQTDYKKKEMGNYPVVYVTLIQANTYCQWVGQRLINEVEWERAARGTDGRPWPWGEQPPSPEYVNMASQETEQPTEGLQPVDSNPKGASPEKVYNLVGNAYEWTSSYAYQGGEYAMNYWDGNPENYDLMQFSAARGGSWENVIEDISRYNSNNGGTTLRRDLGFRCGADAK
jgi:formylglycine-generating enzyme required for sulfatase activity